MAALATATALSCPSDSKARSLRKSTRSVIQRGDDGIRSSARLRIGNNGKKKGVNQKIGDGVEGVIEDGIGEGIGAGSAGGRNDRIGEGIDEKVSDGGSEEVEVGEGEEDVGVRCLCARSVERGDMVCCDVCGGWSHLSCIGVKAGASLLEGKDFVCFFLPVIMFDGTT